MTLQALEDQGAGPAEGGNTLAVAANPLDLPTEVFKTGLQRRGDNRKALMEWIWKALVEGTDYGRIHVVAKTKCTAQAQGRKCENLGHYSKPSLFKPGAEKINGMLGTMATFPALKEYERKVIEGVEIKSIILRCYLKDARRRIVSEGVGARSLQQDYGDLNKALKMCKKSAFIDATLGMGGLSEVFTQDVEDMRVEDDDGRGGDGVRASASGIAEDRLLEILERYIDKAVNVPQLKNWGKKYVDLVGLLSDEGKSQLRQHYAARQVKLRPIGGGDQPVAIRSVLVSAGGTPFEEVLRLAKLAKCDEDRELVLDLARELPPEQRGEIERVLAEQEQDYLDAVRENYTK